MAISKTKLKLVDVARQLFAKKGLEETTMNDIAQASDRGRRTLYTYFKSKEDIYYAVIETELERLTDRMHEVSLQEMPSNTKLLELIFTHLNMIKEAVCRNGNLRAEFFRNIWMVERVRKNFDKEEIATLKRVLIEGQANGYFDIEDIGLTANIIHYCVKGLEVPYIYGRLGEGVNERNSRPKVTRLINRCFGKNLFNEK
jgi:AcrR family transcriptional regulator